MWFETWPNNTDLLFFLTFFFYFLKRKLNCVFAAETLCVIFASRCCGSSFKGVPFKSGFRGNDAFPCFWNSQNGLVLLVQGADALLTPSLRLAARTKFHCQFVFWGKPMLNRRRMSLRFVLCFVFWFFSTTHLTLWNMLFPSRNSHKALKGAAHLFGIPPQKKKKTLSRLG